MHTNVVLIDYFKHLLFENYNLIIKYNFFLNLKKSKFDYYIFVEFVILTKNIVAFPFSLLLTIY